MKKIFYVQEMCAYDKNLLIFATLSPEKKTFGPQLECCGIYGPADWRERTQVEQVCGDVIPDHCYRSHYDRRKRRMLFDCHAVFSKVQQT